MNDDVLRKNLLELLGMGSAHLTLDEAIDGLDRDAAFRRPQPTVNPKSELHSVWELLEHMRIAQEDILRFTKDPTWRSPPWPSGYWPAAPSSETAPSSSERNQRWDETVSSFRSDLEEIRGWVRDDGLELTAEVPHGEGRSYLRQILLVGDHNAYHLAQIVSVRRLLGLWNGAT